MTKDNRRLTEDLPNARPILEGVPQAVADAFFRGLDDAKHGRTVSVDSALAEGRRRIAGFRAKKKKSQVSDPTSQQRE